MRFINFKVTGLGFLGCGTYDTWEEAIANSKDSKGRVGVIIVEMTVNEYHHMVNGYIQKINELKELIKKRDYDHNQNLTQLERSYRKQLSEVIDQIQEKDKRCASLAATVIRLKNKRKSN